MLLPRIRDLPVLRWPTGASGSKLCHGQRPQALEGRPSTGETSETPGASTVRPGALLPDPSCL